MLVFPISDDNPTYSRPYVNYALIAINAAVFLFVVASGRHEEVVKEWGMKPARVWREPFTLISSMFLHAGILHVVGNMWFLWIVGDNVEDALGHVWYLAAYLAGGVAADLAHAGFNPGSTLPTIGASGAVATVVGFYVGVFPHGRIRVFYWFYYFIGTFWARAIWVLGVWWLVLNNLLPALLVGQFTGIAYWAHIGGFAFGAALAVGLRAVWPAVDPHRRHGRERPVPGGMDFGRARGQRDVPIDLGAAFTRGRVPTAEPVSVELFASPEEMERATAGRLASGDVSGAQRAFAALARAHPHRPADVRMQLTLVQALEQRGEHAAAAACLEHFLATRPGDINAPEAKLALGMIYARHLRQRDRARMFLGAAAVQHPVPARAALAREELASLR